MIRALLLALVMTCAQAQPAGLPTRDGLPTLAPILEKVTPAVVNIAVLQRSPEDQNPMLRDPFFRRFFGLPQQAQPQIAAGSGVIVDAKNGYVITNAHVVKDAREIKVTLRDNRELPAKLVGSDPGTDIAVVKVEPRNLVDVKFGDSDELQVGDFVVAIGNPFGLGQTATSGIVSALGRGLNVEGYEHFIQTDASINPGNSGGALVNLKGELIGINTAIIGPANVGIGFAVPSVLASAVMDQLIRFGEVKRGRLGIAMAPSVGGTEGALIAEVEPNSPAATAGLKKGDVVTALNGHPVRGPAELRARLAVVPVGDTVELKVQRGKETPILKAQIGEIEQQAAAGQPIAELNGAALADVQRRGLPGNNRAILVATLETGSPAFNHGLRTGDLIIGVNQRRITTTQELAKALRAQGRLALNVVRGEFLLTIQLR
ncbi:MAG: Do family serine endopeptidase [Betaproteobacteria bacterium]|nr:Do family serine endopeptidase [Betaproteobacteria bacterium]MBV9361100.1 Do family serine endopeptidase [Betaproteobacteria bacterium]